MAMVDKPWATDALQAVGTAVQRLILASVAPVCGFTAYKIALLFVLL